jgi:hypothetical protein
MTDCGQPLLDARCREFARPGLDPGGDVHRLDGCDRRHAGGGAPGQKFLCSSRIARLVCELRILAARNSRKRIEARSPAAAASAGSVAERIETSWFMIF